MYIQYDVCTLHINSAFLLSYIGTLNGTIVAFNATSYSAIISNDTPAQAPVLSVGLTVDGNETYSLSPVQGVSQPSSPFEIQFSGERRGEIQTRQTIFSSQISSYVFSVRAELTTTISITAEVFITIVGEPLSE